MKKKNMLKARTLDDFKNRMQRLRRTMKDLSYATGIKYQTLNGYLNGFTRIPLDKMNIMAAQLHRWEAE